MSAGMVATLITLTVVSWLVSAFLLTYALAQGAKHD
jgi:hypothetical protein